VSNTYHIVFVFFVFFSSLKWGSGCKKEGREGRKERREGMRNKYPFFSGLQVFRSVGKTSRIGDEVRTCAKLQLLTFCRVHTFTSPNSIRGDGECRTTL
jgi:hypothetical protein